MPDARLLQAALIASPPSPSSSFNILLVAEGFQAANEPDFLTECRKLQDALLGTAPFNMLRQYPNRVRVWRHFEASTDPGPALGVTAGNTILRSVYDNTTNTISVDETILIPLLTGLNLPDPAGGAALTAFALTQCRQLPFPGVVAVLVPAAVGGNAISVEADVRPWGSDTGLSYLITTVDSGWPRSVIRALARSMGLGDEFELSGDAYAAPTDLQATNTDISFYNLDAPFHVEGPARPPKWLSEVDAATRSSGLTTVPAGQVSPTPYEPIQLFEGAGWFRSNVYRSAADCLMRRQIGGPNTSPKKDTVPFCLICERYLTRMIAGRTSRPSGRQRLAQQRLLFDKVDEWVTVDRVTQPLPQALSATGPTSRSGPWWSYQATIGPGVNGIQFTDLKLEDQQPDSLATDQVAQLIEFRDIVVIFDNGDVKPFDFTSAFSNATDPPTLTTAEDGTVNADIDSNYLRGLKLTLTDDFGGRSKVQVDLSLVLKGYAADIEPSGSIGAVKLHPQIGLTWYAGGTSKVERFRGCVRVVLNNQANANAMPGMTGMLPDETVASFFTDTNLGFMDVVKDIPAPGQWGRRREVVEGNAVLPALGFPLWTFVFDYHNPAVSQDTEISAVVGPAGPSARRKDRKDSCTWPPIPGSSYILTTRKVGDQGDYDNVHIHGSMGVDPFDPAGGPMVHAPGCAEACVHLHWRWGNLAVPGTITSPVHSAQFYGWSRPALDDAAEHDENGAPLIPPNQDLSIALTHPDTNRTDPMSAVVTSSRPLDKKVKAIWYTADVDVADRDGQLQAIFQPGISFAYRYEWSALLQSANLHWFRSIAPNATDGKTDLQVQHVLYSFIRWFLDSSWKAQAEQIPLGSQPTDSRTTFEKL